MTTAQYAVIFQIDADDEEFMHFKVWRIVAEGPAILLVCEPDDLDELHTFERADVVMVTADLDLAQRVADAIVADEQTTLDWTPEEEERREALRQQFVDATAEATAERKRKVNRIEELRNEVSAIQAELRLSLLGALPPEHPAHAIEAADRAVRKAADEAARKRLWARFAQIIEACQQPRAEAA